jgi:hypothetical protein
MGCRTGIRLPSLPLFTGFPARTRSTRGKRVRSDADGARRRQTAAAMPFHVDLHSGGIWSGESAYAWNLDEDELRVRFLEPRSAGQEVWVQGKPFRWGEAKIRIFDGPETSEIPDFTSALGPAAYEMARTLTEVTDKFITGPPGGIASETVPGNAVFVVHGSNIARREEVARFLSIVLDTDTPVVVLHEQSSRGRTLLEKFEATAAHAQYAVVLLTGDDESRPRGSETWELRARQNVVFELGFFFGKLGRERVAVLYESGVERPSDIEGLVYIALDEAGGWKLQIAREMRGVGLNVDLNRLGGDSIP